MDTKIAAAARPPRARVIAFYLPQFHPIPENDKWWGPGFTEWTNVARAKPFFPGHVQPNIPADLGFYDLRLPETRAAQADLARSHGIEGFCYWHYWFAGDRLLQRPFNEVLNSGEPDFPFCLGWANETWSAAQWKGGGLDREIIKAQTYPGRDDYDRHFDFLLPAFTDHRYIRVNSKPLLLIHKPLKIPDCRRSLDYLRDLAVKNGLPGLHFVAALDYPDRLWDAAGNGFDAITVWPLRRVAAEAKPLLLGARLFQMLQGSLLSPLRLALQRLTCTNNHVFDYEQLLQFLLTEPVGSLPLYQMAIPNWDTTPRYGKRGIVFHNSTPELFKRHLRQITDWTLKRPLEEQIIFLKSWNEWAEGNYVEPDLRFGRQYLEMLQAELFR